jgi:hypothetical protein
MHEQQSGKVYAYSNTRMSTFQMRPHLLYVPKCLDRKVAGSIPDVVIGIFH